MDYLSGWCKSKKRLDGCTAIVTGSNTGIGKETALDLYKRGARVIMACRNVDRAKAAKADIEQVTDADEGTGELEVGELDLCSLSSVRAFVRLVTSRERELRVLVCNAGVMMCAEGRTHDGFETHFGSNHLGHALLSLLLLPMLIKSGPSRIVFVSSYVHAKHDLDLDDLNFERKPYNAFEAYCRSKAANILFARALADKLREHNIPNVTTYSLHPGVIRTEISRHFDETIAYGTTWAFNNLLRLFLKSPPCGAQTTIYCALDDACAEESGLYYCDCAVKKPSKQCQDAAQAAKLWDVTIEALKLNLTEYNPFREQNLGHKSLFDGTLGKYTGGEAELRVRASAVPVFCRARPLPYALRERVDAELDAMLRTGVIEPVEHSDWATPLVVVRKADGGLRICADYKVTLNRALEIDRFPVPKMEDLFSNLSGNKYFTKLDLSQAYNQVVLSEPSRQFTVINTHRGLFKYSRLVYGLSSSPGIFQKIMVDLFRNMPNVVVFYDDVLIKDNDLKTHLKSIEEVLEILSNNGLKIKKSKCAFLCKEVKYLGFIIDEQGVRVDPEKVSAITTMPHPSNVSELKSFIGMVNFYGKFIENLSTYLAPLYALLKKGRHWKWDYEQNVAFIKVKKMLCSTKALVHFDMSAESVLTVDASARGIGAVLAQRAPGTSGAGAERVVACASRVLTTHELHYSQIHKEALAIVFALEKFHQYLYGRKFVLRTDHKPLISIFGPNIGIPSAAASRLQRWAIKLSAYDFDIEYIRTDRNTADVLSRLIESQKNEVGRSEEKDLPEQTYLHFATDALLLDYNILKKETRSDPILSRVLSYIMDGWPTEVVIKELAPYFNRKNELYCELGCIMWGHRVIIPSSCRRQVVLELHDPHMGIVKTKALARSYVWWPGIDEAVEAECQACTVCAAVATAPPAHASNSWPWPSRPWSRLHLDFLGPIEGITYLVVVDSCSKWIEIKRMNRTTAQSVIAVLREMWAKFGIPKQTVSDNGPPFSSSEFQNFLKHNGIKHIFTAPYHPASNGAAENAVKICKRVIKKALKQNVNVDTALCRFLLAYRNTEHYTTGESPANILLGRSLRMRLDNLKPERETRVAEHQAQSELSAAGSRRRLELGAPVWYREYRGPDKWVAGSIIKQIGNTDYCIRSLSGMETHRHVDQLRPRVTDRVVDESARNSVDKNISPALATTKAIVSRQSRRSLGLATASGEEADRGNREVDSTINSSPTRARGPMAAVQGEVAPSSNSPGIPSVSTNTEQGMVADNTGRPIRSRKPPLRYGFEID